MNSFAQLGQQKSLFVNKMVPWTKLGKDAIWSHVSVKYMEPVGRYYHNMQHVVDLYNYAHELKIPYDINLDVAILFHDIVYDDKDNKEIRSAYEFMQRMKAFNGGKEVPEKMLMPFGVVNTNIVADAILGTISHNPDGKDTSARNLLILLDLYGMTKKKAREEGFNNLMNEIDVLYSANKELNEKTVIEEMGRNLVRIYGNLLTYVTKVKDDPEKNLIYMKEWEQVCEGVAAQIKHAKAKYENVCKRT